MAYFVGIDGGGSKTAVWVADEQGQVVGRGTAGPTNLTTTDTNLAKQQLALALHHAVVGLSQPKFEAVVMGLAGADTPSELSQAAAVFQPEFAAVGIAQFRLVNDVVVALKSGSDAANALVVIAGTGSNAYGRNAQGQTALASGLDYWLSDEGSGSALGLAALRSAVRSADGRGLPTKLLPALLERFGLKNYRELKSIVYAPEFSKKELAALAPLVVKAAAAGDKVAYEIMRQTVAEIESMIEAIVTRLQFSSQTFDCVVVGSIGALEWVKRSLQIWFSSRYPQARLVYPVNPPVQGALQLAFQSAFLASVS